MHPASRRWLRRCTAALTVTTAGAVLVLGAPVTTTSHRPPGGSAAEDGLALASADPHTWPLHPGRRLVRHTVRPGDTATGLAVRYHAWTRELRSLNHLGRHGTLYVGQRIRIPVVVAAARTAHTHKAPPRHTTQHGKPAKARHHRRRSPRHLLRCQWPKRSIQQGPLQWRSALSTRRPNPK